MARPPSALRLTALDPGYRTDPHTRLDRVRTTSPAWYDTVLGGFIFTRYADVSSLLNDTSLWRDPDKAAPQALLYRSLRLLADGLERPDEGRAGMLLMDEPDHSRVRSAVAGALNRRTLKARPVIEGAIGDTLSCLSGRSEFDLVSDYAAPIALRVITRIIGLDEDRLPRLRKWSEAIFEIFKPGRSASLTARMLASSDAARAYIGEVMEARRAKPAGDLISDLLAAQRDGEAISDGEIRTNCYALFNAGNLTTADLIANGLYLLLSHPSELALLRARPKLIPSAVEEILRYEPPVETTARVASRDLTVCGMRVEQRQVVFLSLTGANRDPDALLEPHRFHIERRDAKHVSFGGGAHRCIGETLARMEARLAIGAAITRLPPLTLDKGKVEWRAAPGFRGLKRLRVHVS